MTDPYWSASEGGAPAPDAGPPPPSPLPVPRADRGWRRPAVLIAAAVVVVLSAIGAGCWAVSRVLEQAGFPPFGSDFSSDASMAYEELTSDASVWWCGDGRYAVAQVTESTDDGAYAAVLVCDTKTGKTRIAHKTRVVAVEQAAPRLWVAPEADSRDTGAFEDGATSPPVPRPLDLAGDGVDRVARGLAVWDLDREGTDADPAGPEWGAWPSRAASVTAVLIVDRSKGCLPSDLRLGAVKAAVPADAGTFEPIGWSPSGRFFAVITQVAGKKADADLDAYAKSWQAANDGPGITVGTTDEPASPSQPLGDSRVLVFDATTGALAESLRVAQPLFNRTSGAALAVWDGETLLVMDDGAKGGLKRASPLAGASATKPVTLADWWAGDYRGHAFFAGGSPEGPVACRSTSGFADIWRQGSDGGAVHLGTVGPFGAGAATISGDVSASQPIRWREGAGLLWLRDGSREDGFDPAIQQLVVTDVHGGARRVLGEMSDTPSQDSIGP